MKRGNMNRLLFKTLVNIFIVVIIFSANRFEAVASEWNLDQAHTSINFKVNHFSTPVTGRFDDYDIDLTFDPNNLKASSVHVRIQTSSINTGYEPRDKHLKTEDWFDVETYPEMSFTSSEIVRNDDGTYIARGTLKIKGIKKEIELPFKLLGVERMSEEMKKNAGGIDRIASFETEYSIDRTEFDIGTGASTPGFAASMYRQSVGKEVKISIAVEVNRTKS